MLTLIETGVRLECLGRRELGRNVVGCDCRVIRARSLKTCRVHFTNSFGFPRLSVCLSPFFSIILLHSVIAFIFNSILM